MVTINAIDTQNPIQVAKGGTGVASNTAYAVLCGGTTGTAAVQSIASVGTSGQALTSNGAGALPTFQTIPLGPVVQQVRSQSNANGTLSTVIPRDDTIPQNTEGSELLTLSITPTNASHILVIQLDVYLDGGGTSMATALFQDSTADAIASACDTGGQGGSCPITYYMTAGTTSSTTFKMRAGRGAAGSWTYNLNEGSTLGDTMYMFMTITEYST